MSFSWRSRAARARETPWHAPTVIGCHFIRPWRRPSATHACMPRLKRRADTLVGILLDLGVASWHLGTLVGWRGCIVTRCYYLCSNAWYTGGASAHCCGFAACPTMIMWQCDTLKPSHCARLRPYHHITPTFSESGTVIFIFYFDLRIG